MSSKTSSDAGSLRSITNDRIRGSWTNRSPVSATHRCSAWKRGSHAPDFSGFLVAQTWRWTSFRSNGAPFSTTESRSTDCGTTVLRLTTPRNATSPHGGTKRGKWPFRVDPNNRQQIFFYNEDSGSWHALDWNGRESIPQPFSSEVYRYATRIAASTHKIPDSRRALRELLERWEAGVVSNPIERRMWLRLSAETEQQLPDELTAVLPSDTTPGNAVEDPLLVVSDDDMVEELLDASGDDGDFYGDAYELGE